MRRGATLLELIIAVSIFMGVMTAACSTIVPGLRAFRETNARATTQEQVLVCLKKLQQDLEFSDVSTLTLYNGSDLRGTVPVSALSYISSRPNGGPMQLDAGGFPSAQVTVIYYVAHDAASLNTGHALFQQQSITTAGRITAFTPAPGYDRVVLRNVARFEVSAPLGTALSSKDVNGLRKNPVSIVLSASSGRYVTTSGASATMMENIYLNPVPDDAL